MLKKRSKDTRGAMDIAGMNSLIEELNFHISSGNLDIAKSSYTNLIKAYDFLSKGDKKTLHDAMNEVYERLQTLIKNPKISMQENVSTAMKYAKNLIDETTFYINASNLTSARRSYSDTLKAYDSLNLEEKKLLHPTVNELYMQLQGMSSKPAKIDVQMKLLSKTIDEAHGEAHAEGLMQPKIPSIGPSKVSEDVKPQAVAHPENVIEPAAKETPTELLEPAVNLGESNVLFVAGSSKTEPEIKHSGMDGIGISRNISNLHPPNNLPLPANLSPISNLPPPEKSAIILPSETDKVVESSGVEKKDKLSKAKVSDATKGDIQTPPSIHDNIKSASEIEAEKASHAMIEKLLGLLDKIAADVVLDKFDDAKETYKDALLMYRKMDDVQKSKCYDKFYDTFRKLDEVLHRRSLHDLLDRHTNEIRSSKRAITSDTVSSGSKPSESNHEESIRISKMTTLPVLLSNDEQTIRVYELIEESYFNIDNKHPDLAMLKYFKALEFYRKLSVEDKKRLYIELYDLFKRLSIPKKA